MKTLSDSLVENSTSTIIDCVKLYNKLVFSSQ